MGGDFILRIEDTDSERFVDGSIEYIIASLKWLGIEPNEGYGFGDGEHFPYIQSKRLDIYKPYIDKLISDGNAYYAFDTTDELSVHRASVKNFTYGHSTRMNLNNSLNMSSDKLNELLSNGTPYVIRAKLPYNKVITFDDTVRGKVSFNTSNMDDKVLVKSDGVPTYHLASTIDDYTMGITNVLRGDEWLPSAPLHVLLHSWLGNTEIPTYSHLSVILRPDGKKKLSKRDGDELGICVFPLEYMDDDGVLKKGYRESGYLPVAMSNILSLLGWNPADGSTTDVMNMDDLLNKFSLEHLHKAGARFDKKKAEFLNKQHIMKLSNDEFVDLLYNNIERPSYLESDELWRKKLLDIVPMVNTKLDSTNDVKLYLTPLLYRNTPVNDGIDTHISVGLLMLIESFKCILVSTSTPEDIENIYKSVLSTNEKLSSDKKAFMRAFRRSLTSEDVGVSVYHLVAFIGIEEATKRIIKYIDINM